MPAFTAPGGRTDDVVAALEQMKNRIVVEELGARPKLTEPSAAEVTSGREHVIHRRW